MTSTPFPIVTVSAPYGTGGSEIGPRLAEAFGVPFLDRAIPTAVAEQMSVPLERVLREDEAPPGALDRLLGSFASFAPLMAGAPIEAFEGAPLPRATEQVIKQRVEEGGGVVLGRAGAIVLHDRPGALHVRLAGPVERRIEQGMRIEGVDRATAEERLEKADRARDAYVQHFYRADPADPAHYHLVVDSTAIPIDGCVAAIADAGRALAAARPAGGLAAGS